MENEQWVGLRELAKHLGFSYSKTRKLANLGKIPGGHPFPSGENTHWRFKLSEVDRALMQKTA